MRVPHSLRSLTAVVTLLLSATLLFAATLPGDMPAPDDSVPVVASLSVQHASQPGLCGLHQDLGRYGDLETTCTLHWDTGGPTGGGGESITFAIFKKKTMVNVPPAPNVSVMGGPTYSVKRFVAVTDTGDYWNNSISSIKLSRMFATLWDGKHLTYGAEGSITLTGNVSDLDAFSFANKTSSYVMWETNWRKSTCRVYRHPSYSGESLKLHVEKGAWFYFRCPYLGDHWNDEISSITTTGRQNSGMWEFYKHSKYGGTIFELAPGHSESDLSTHGMNDEISSFRFRLHP